MPTPISLPFPPLRVLKCDGPITWDWLKQEIEDRLEDGVSLCLVAKKGHENQGGYFFHIQKRQERFAFFIFEQKNALNKSVLTFDTGHECVALINHVSGRRYDQGMWSECQKANLKSDD